MNMISKSPYLAVILSAFVFFSCKKDDTTPPPPDPQEPTLFEKVQGRWNATVEPVGRIATPSNASHKNLDMPRVTSVSFFEDSSYILVFNYGYAYSGKLSVTDSTSFDFKGFGPVTNLQITGDSISFNCVYNEEIPLSVKAGKVADITVTDAQKPLLKTWVMTDEEDGAAYYEEHEAEAGSVKFTFTPVGIALITNNDGEDLLAQNWKWHSDVTDAVVFYYSNDNINYSVYYKITELNNSTLKVEETAVKDGQGPSVTATYIFNAVK